MLKLKVRKHGSDYQELLLEPGREYFVGRAPNSDVVLDDLPGISRQHFKIQFVDECWQIQVMSKFGNLTKDGEPTNLFNIDFQDAFKLSPYDFIVLQDNEQLDVQEAQTSSKALAIIPPSEPPQVYDEDFQGDNEITSVGNFRGVPYLRISGPHQLTDEVLRLEGKSWIAGRDENCSIILNDATASRKQFRIDIEEDEYFITDVGSSNGTLINGARVANRTPLKSGDIISVQSLTIHFELRDPGFKEKIQGLSENFVNTPALIIEKEPAFQHPSFMPASYTGDGGAIPLHYQGNQYSGSQHSPKKNKKLLIYGAIGIVVVLGLFLFSDNTKKGDPNQANAIQTTKFEHLSIPQKQLVADSYNLANNFLLQGKYSNAQAQLNKISEILGDEAYMDSRSLTAQCQTAIDNEGKIAKIESERMHAEQVSKRLSEILYRCNQVSRTAVSEQAIDQCLEEAINLDPGNDEIGVQKERVRKRISDNNDRLSQKADYRARVERAREMYNHARSLEAKGELLQAIEAYERLAKTNLPDPEDRKKEAQRKIASIKQSLSQKAEDFIRTGQKFAEQNNLKGALSELMKAQKIDANNAHVNTMIRKYRGDLDLQLQDMYGEATIYEGNSRLERALEIWKKIVELDRSDGEYYRKAKSKLKTYGSH